MFLPKDPVAVREVLQNTPLAKMKSWLFILNLLLESDEAALEASCMMDDAYTIEEVREEARASITSIKSFIDLGVPSPAVVSNHAVP